MSVTVTFRLWWLWAYLSVGAVLCVPMMLYAETQMSGPFRWSHALWRARYHGETSRTRTLKALFGYPAVIVGWPLALWEILH